VNFEQSLSQREMMLKILSSEAHINCILYFYDKMNVNICWLMANKFAQKKK